MWPSYLVQIPRPTRSLRPERNGSCANRLNTQADLVHAALTLSPLDFSLPEPFASIWVCRCGHLIRLLMRALRNLSAGTTPSSLTIRSSTDPGQVSNRVIVFSDRQGRAARRLGVRRDGWLSSPRVDTSTVLHCPPARSTAELASCAGGSKVAVFPLYMGRATEKERGGLC